MTNRFVLFILLALTTFVANAQKKTVVPMDTVADFRANITFMMPRQFSSRPVDDYSIEVSGDTATVHLPYIGEAYSPTLDSDGLNFTHRIENRRSSFTKKGAWVLKFDLHHGSVSYAFSITMFDNGNIDVDMTPSNAQSCSYSGNWEKANK